MAEQLLGDFVIEEDLQMEIKTRPSHKNQSYVIWCAILDTEINKTR